MQLTPLAVSSAPLLKAIAAAQSDDDLTPKALAEVSGRKPNNIARDLRTLEEAGWICPEPPPHLTDEGLAMLAALARAEGDGDGAQEIPLHLIDEKPGFNPRTNVDEAADAELTASIGAGGVLQPILIRPREDEAGRFYVVAGHRRRRCALAAGLFVIPALVKPLDDAQAHEMATIENLQREDMSPIDEARAFRTIVANRMAADPDLKLKDAKAVAAERVKKTVRYVEQRLDLLELPAADQDRLALPEDAAGALTVTEARRKIQFLRKQAREAEKRKLSPAALLVCVEIDAAGEATAENPAGWFYENPAVEIRFDAAGEIFDELIAREALAVHRGHLGANEADRTRTFVRLGYAYGPEEIRRQLAAYAPDLSPDEQLAKLRADVAGEDFDAVPLGGYATPWLNGPFEPDPALVAQEAERAERRAEQAARDDEATEQRRAAAAAVERELGEFGRGFLQSVRDFEAGAPMLDDAAFRAAFREAWAVTDAAGPWSLKATGDTKDPTELVDGDGAPNRAAGPALEARRRLMAIALNFAAGLPTYSGEPIPSDWTPGPGAKPLDDEPCPACGDQGCGVCVPEEDDGSCPACGACDGFIGAECDGDCDHARAQDDDAPGFLGGDADEDEDETLPIPGFEPVAQELEPQP